MPLCKPFNNNIALLLLLLLFNYEELKQKQLYQDSETRLNRFFGRDERVGRSSRSVQLINI